MGCDGYLLSGNNSYIKFQCYTCGKTIENYECYEIIHKNCVKDSDGNLKVTLDYNGYRER